MKLLGLEFFLVLMFCMVNLFFFFSQECGFPFGSGSFFDHDGLPYCETHYHAKRGSLCAGCHKPITGSKCEFSVLGVQERFLVSMCGLALERFVSVCREMYHCNVQEVPSRTLRLRLLPEAAQQRNIQGTERQTLLSSMLHQIVWISVEAACVWSWYWVPW